MNLCRVTPKFLQYCVCSLSLAIPNSISFGICFGILTQIHLIYITNLSRRYVLLVNIFHKSTYWLEVWKAHQVKELLLGKRCQSTGWPGAPARSEPAEGTNTVSRVSLTHLSSVDLLLEGTYQALRKGEVSYILDKELFDLNRISPCPSLWSRRE